MEYMCFVCVFGLISCVDGLTFDITGDFERLTPPPPSPAFLDEVTSNTTFIDVTWNASLFSFSDVFYQIQLNLTTAVEEIRPSIMANVRTRPLTHPTRPHK